MPYADTPDGPLYYEHVNCQPPWQPATPVLLHHGIALTSDFWYAWLPILAAAFPVVRFDWRGYGRSHVPEPGYPWSLEQFGRDALAVLAAAGLRALPLRGRVDGGHHRPLPRQPRPRAHRHADHRLDGLPGRVRARPGRLGDDIRGRRRRGLVPSDDAAPPGPRPRRSGTCCLVRARAGPRRAPRRPRPRRRPARCRPHRRPRAHPRPATGAHAGDSPFVSSAIAADLHARVPGSELLEFPGARHAVITSHARECAAAVVDFIQRRAPAGGA